MSIGSMATAKVVQIVGMQTNVDGIWIDQEHTATPQQALEVLVMAARSVGLDSFVRVAPTDYATVMRPLETGAGGVMAAQIRSVEEARQVMRWATFPPQGERGLFGGNFDSGFKLTNVAEHLARRNCERLLVLQIETAEAVADVEKIAAIDGVDNLFIGPADLANNLGVPGEMTHPKCLDALKRVAAAAAAAGKSWGALSPNPEHAAKCRELGCRLFSVVGDTMSFIRGANETLAEMDAVLGT